MSKADRKIAVKLLKGARKLIKETEEIYVCHAINRALDGNVDQRRRISNKLQSWIMDSMKETIGYHHGITSAWYVDRWLLSHGISSSLHSWKNMRKYRMRWIDQMIDLIKEGKGPV